MSRLAVSCAAVLSATALAAACSVYDESLLGAGGVDDTSSSKSGKGNGGETGDGGAGPTTTDGSTTSDATGSTADGSTGQTGTVTTGEQCQTPDDCPGEDSVCSERSCEGNQCSVINKDADFVVESQTPGDCIVQVCDGQGNLISDVDDADLPTQTDDCIVPTCTNGAMGTRNADPREACGDGDLCDGAGLCVDCLENEDCDGAAQCSAAHTCVDPDCNDDVLNGDETDEDCGGIDCDPCINGLMCDGPTDCVSGVCTGGTCRPSCSDLLLNNGETDVDCGGPNCDECGIGLACDGPLDCTSGFCLADACRPNVFFSEYVEGLSNNKAIEIFNYGNVPIDLEAAGCSVTISRNGGSTMATISLSGTLDVLGGDDPPVTVICYQPNGSQEPLDAVLASRCDVTDGALNHNGNDALILSCGGAVLDNFGQVGTDPGTQWGSGITGTKDHTLRRKGSVEEGDRVGSDAFTPSAQWDGFLVDTFDGLGDHP